MGGGTGLLFKGSIYVSNITSGSKSSFEFAEYLLSAGSFRLRLAIVYRPPYFQHHPVTINTFLEEFSGYLESIILSSEPLFLTGDFNIHVDDPNDSAADYFRELLESMSLTQHVLGSTHVCHPFTWSVWNILLTETYFAFFTFPSDISCVTHSV